MPMRMSCGKASWRQVYAILTLMLLSVLVMFNLITDRYVHHIHWYDSPAPCVTPARVMDEMVNMSFVISDMLNSFQVPHVLCYGSLWGALKIGKILPWDNNVDFCVIKDDLDKAPWSKLLSAMQAHGFEATYDYRHGELVIKKNSSTSVISVFQQTKDGKTYRDGWEYRFLFLFQRSQLSFPAALMEAPLPTLTFHGRPGMPVPHDDMEMLKYMYPDDWWMERPPPGCKGLVDYACCDVLGGPEKRSLHQFNTTV